MSIVTYQAARLLLFVLVWLPAAPGEQQPTATWAIAKPLVDKWDAAYRAAGRTKAAAEEIVADIRRLLGEHPEDIWAYEAAALGYNHLNRNRDAVEITRLYLRRFPSDTTLDARVLFFFGNWGSAYDLEELPERWHGQVEYWRDLLEAYAREKALPKKLERAGTEYLSRAPVSVDTGAGARFRVVEAWLAGGVDPVSAERVAREAVAISELGDRPSLSTQDAERQLILGRLLITNLNRSALGWALYQQGRFADALTELRRAADLAEREKLTTRNVFYRLGQTLETLGRFDEAMEAYCKELAWGVATDITQAAIRTLQQRKGARDRSDADVRTRVNELVAKRLESARDLVRSTDEPLGQFDLLDDRGLPANLDQYRGSVVVIDFWATWCAPCHASMRHTDELQKRFGNDLVVVAPTMDSEETHARAAAILHERGYRFRLLYDDEKRRSIRLPFIPARLLLDRGGRLRVIEFGATAAGAALFEERLQALLKE